MPRNTQPVSPRPVLTGLIHQTLANVKNHSTDHANTLRQQISGTRELAHPPMAPGAPPHSPPYDDDDDRAWPLQSGQQLSSRADRHFTPHRTLR